MRPTYLPTYLPLSPDPLAAEFRGPGIIFVQSKLLPFGPLAFVAEVQRLEIGFELLRHAHDLHDVGVL